MIKRPILRYFGGKFRLAPHLIAMMPPHENYIEPFAGAASVLLRKPKSPGLELLVEKDPEIHSYLLSIRNHGHEMADLVSEMKPDRELYDRAWSECGLQVSGRPALDNALGLCVKSFLTRATVGKISGKSSFRDHPISIAAWKTLPDALRCASDRMSEVALVNGDWESALAFDSPDTFFYLDPPYLKSTRSSSHGYNYDFTEDDHKRMSHVLYSCHSAKIMVSGYDSDLYRHIFSEPYWRKAKISAAKDSGSSGIECVWMNYG